MRTWDPYALARDLAEHGDAVACVPVWSIEGEPTWAVLHWQPEVAAGYSRGGLAVALCVAARTNLERAGITPA